MNIEQTLETRKKAERVFTANCYGRDFVYHGDETETIPRAMLEDLWDIANAWCDQNPQSPE